MNNTTSGVMRFNITLPSDIANKLKKSKNRSALIAESLRQKFEREEKEQLNSVLIKAYADASKEDKQLVDDWDATTGDGL